MKRHFISPRTISGRNSQNQYFIYEQTETQRSEITLEKLVVNPGFKSIKSDSRCLILSH